jgi:hypothetical protein
MLENLATQFKGLPMYIKCIFIGTFVTFAGLFFNWYTVVDDLDRTIRFNALNGPTFLVGYSLLIFSVYSFLAMLKYLKKTECEITLLKKYYVEKWSGIVISYLSIVTISFYLTGIHVNSLQKNIGVGFFLSLTGGLIIIIGNILFKTKERKIKTVDTNQLNLNFDGNEHSEAESVNDLKFVFNTREIIDNMKSENNPILKEQLRKQREIEDKITNR